SRSAIEAVIDFSWYRHYTRPRLEVITCIVDVCQRNANLEPLARSLSLLEEIFYFLGNYGDFQAAYQQVFVVYGELGDPRGVVNSLKGLGDTHEMEGRHTGSDGISASLWLYGEADGRLSMANCMRGLG
ncbi:hypothetical protein FRB97_001862, partial [Tulasnella sp. 331]